MRLVILFLTLISLVPVHAQTDTGQTIAAIPSKEGELLVQNGRDNEVWLVSEGESVSLVAEEALRVAGWIKEGRTGHYSDAGPFRLRREADLLVVTLAPEKGAKRELRLGEAEGLQFAAALASARQNVSEAGQ